MMLKPSDERDYRLDDIEIYGLTARGHRVLYVADHLTAEPFWVRLGYRLNDVGWNLPGPLWPMTRPMRRLGLWLMGAL